MLETLRRLFRRGELRYEGLDHLIIGLGNPGRRYAATRHNVAWMALDRLATRARIEFRPGRGDFHAARWSRPGGDALLLLPGTFMNRSGRAALQAAELTGLGPDRALVLTDDLDLPLGRLRLRGKGGAGGHRGLASLIESWGTERFDRLRLGIGRPPAGDAAEHVLSAFAEDELDLLDKMIDAAADAVTTVLDQGLERAMGSFNSTTVR